MMGHKVCFYGKIWIIIPKLSVTPSYLEHWSQDLSPAYPGDIHVGGRLNPSSLTNSPPIHKDFLDISHNDPAHLMHVVSLRKVMEKCDKNQIIHSLGFHEVYHAVDGNHFADGGLNSCMVNPGDFQNSKGQHSNNTRHVPRELWVWQFPGNYLNNYFQFG